MWRWDEEQRIVAQLEAERAGDDLFYELLEARQAQAQAHAQAHAHTDPFASPQSRSVPVTLRQLPDGSVTAALGGAGDAAGFSASESSTQRRIRELTLRSPDVLLHIGACAFAVHMKVLKLRCHTLYRKLLMLVHGRVPQDRIDTHPVTGLKLFSLRVLSRGDEAGEDDEPMEPPRPFVTSGNCPLEQFENQIVTVYGKVKPAWLFTRCISHWYVNKRRNQVQSHGQHQHFGPSHQYGFASPRVEVEDLDTGDRVAYAARLPPDSYREQHEQMGVVAASGGRLRDIAHVEMLRADPEALATCMEFIYTKKVRFVNDSCAEQVSRLCEWLDLKGGLYYRALDMLVARVTPRTWMDLLCRCAAMTDENARQVLIQRLLDFMPTLRSEHYQELMQHTEMGNLSAIADRRTLIKVVVAFIHYARMLDIWWNLFSGLECWIEIRGPLANRSLETPSLLALHKCYAPWDPVVLIPKFEFYHRQETGVSVSTIAEFGEFVIQILFELDGDAPILWRVIKRNSPKYPTGEPIELEADSKALKNDPPFCIRGQIKLKYQRPSRLHEVIKAEVSVRYQHCISQYGNWQPLVSSRSTTAMVKPATSEWWAGSSNGGYTSGKTIARLRGRLFILDTLCNVYHYLLASTLFYSPPTSAPPDIADLMIIQEMQRLPLETLILVLLSDRLRIPGGETTLVRILTKMIFDAPPGQFSSSGRVKDPNWRGFNGTATEVVQIFRCVRWCFVQLPQIMKTLARAPRCLRLYELIHDGLQHTHLRFRRRAPWGWRHTRDAYSTNTTNLADFEIEAGDEHVSPSQVEMPEDIDDLPDFPPILPGVA